MNTKVINLELIEFKQRESSSSFASSPDRDEKDTSMHDEDSIIFSFREDEIEQSMTLFGPNKN